MKRIPRKECESKGRGFSLSALGIVGVVAGVVYALLCGCCVFMYYREGPKKKKKKSKEEKAEATHAELLQEARERMREEMELAERERKENKRKERGENASIMPDASVAGRSAFPGSVAMQQVQLPMQMALSPSGAMSVSPSFAGTVPYPMQTPSPVQYSSSGLSLSPSVMSSPVMMMPPTPPGMVLTSSPSYMESQHMHPHRTSHSSFLNPPTPQHRQSVQSVDPLLMHYQDIYERRQSVDIPMMDMAVHPNITRHAASNTGGYY